MALCLRDSNGVGCDNNCTDFCEKMTSRVEKSVIYSGLAMSASTYTRKTCQFQEHHLIMVVRESMPIAF